MHINDFDYSLPAELIAKYPLAERDQCRLLYMERGRPDDRGGPASIQPSAQTAPTSIPASTPTQSPTIRHLAFRDILKILRRGDRLVFNDTRVIPARVLCRKEATGAAIELFFTERVDDRRWKALVKPAKRAPVGSVVHVDGCPSVQIRIDGVMADGYERIVSLVPAPEPSLSLGMTGGFGLDEVINAHGRIPLPHYLERDDEEADGELYQTVYAGAPGAVAAPTAGLHFTDELLGQLDDMGVGRSFVTLHVGIGTFRPVQVDDPRQHDIHEERFELSETAAGEINGTWERGGRVIAVGTTVVRTLESCAVSTHKVTPKASRTKLMILPPHDFKAVDGLITNFHLPKSTLLMLVSAFAGSTEAVINSYKEAINKRYRFYSYGDAMLIV